MKTSRLICTLAALCWLALPAAAQSQEAPLTQKDLGNRKALVGNGCVINQYGSAAQLLTNYGDLEAVTDEDLNNFTTITGVSVGTGVRPIFGVRDTRHTYAPGVKAGFTIVSPQQGGLLGLNLASTFTIITYLDGEMQESLSIDEELGTGVDLNLIKIPGSDNVSVDLTVTPTKEFDEVYLQTAGLDVEAISQLGIKYAFVGESTEYPLTTNGVKDFNDSLAINLEGCEGMPWPVDNWIRHDDLVERFYDDDLTDKLTTGGIAIGEWCHVHTAFNQTLEAGTEVGFVYSNKGLLDLNLGGFTTISFYRNGDKVQEERLEASVLGLGVINTSDQIKSAATANVEFDAVRFTIGAGALAVNAGELAVYYGFIKKKPIVDHHCPINANVGTNICDAQTTFQLLSNASIPVVWSITEAPTDEAKDAVKIDGNGYVTNLTENGDYTFRATATDGCYEEVVLNKGTNLEYIDEATCSTPLVNDGTLGERFELSEEPENQGALISISDLKDPNNVLSGASDAYATFTNLTVAGNISIIGVKSKDSESFSGIMQWEAGESLRTGFIIENTSTFLNANVLNFYRILLYNDGEEIDPSLYNEGVIDESNAVGVGLIGDQQSQKTRFSIQVPAGIEFDEIRLWTSGVADIGLTELRIYNAFVERASDNCSDPLGQDGCIIPISIENGATVIPQIDFQTVSAASAVTDISHLVDNDMNTCMLVATTAEVGGGTIFRVKLGRTADYHQQFGLVMDNATFVAGIGVAGWMTIETYLDGEPTGEEFTNWSVLGLDVIGYGDKKYLISRPKQPYDEIRITIAGVATVLDYQRYYGLFFRNDTDYDGLPDCQDSESCTTGFDIEAQNQICANSGVDLAFTFSGGVSGVEYTLSCPALGFAQKFKNAQTAGDPIDVTIPDETFKEAGRYSFLIQDGSGNTVNNFMVYVYPQRTTWRTNAVDQDWNNWSNWTNGSPYCCTDVIIPSGAERYPVLPTDENGEIFCCDGIHFAPGAEVVNTLRLAYAKAWVETALRPNRYYLFTPPLQAMITGDMFIPEALKGGAMTDYFVALDGTTAPESRLNPSVYQRVWQTYVNGKLLNNQNEAMPVETNPEGLAGQWSRNFNALLNRYNAGNGIALWVDNGNLPAGQDFVFRFPKEHTAYSYRTDYNEVIEDMKDQSTTQADPSIVDYGRLGTPGRFAYELAEGMAASAPDDNYPESKAYAFPTTAENKPQLTLKVMNDAEILTGGSGNSGFNKCFLAGNPFMSYIDMKSFLEANAGTVGEISVYDGNSYSNASLDGEGNLVFSGTGQPLIAPMEAFLATVKDEANIPTEQINSDGAASYKDKYVLSITFTPDMLVDGHSTQPAANAPAATGLRVIAQTGDTRSAVWIDGEQTDDATGELMTDGEVTPRLALFAAVDGKARVITSAQAPQIAMGMMMERADSVTLSFEPAGGFDLSAWQLEDRETGFTYALDAPAELPKVGTNAGRFVLTRTATDAATGKGTDVYVELTAQGTAMVKSTATGIARLSVHDTAGRLLKQTAAHGSLSAEVALPQGVSLLTAELSNGSRQTFKLMR